MCTFAAEGSQASETIPDTCCNAVLSEIKQSPKASVTVLRMGASGSSRVLRDSKVVLWELVLRGREVLSCIGTQF